MELQGGDPALEKYREKAEANVTKAHRGVRGNKRLQLVAEEMSRLASADGYHDQSSAKRARKMVDIFLVGWEGASAPQWPENKKPSEFLVLGDLIEVANMITEHVPELTRMGAEESKN
jgi:hypothetical protein